MTIEPSQAATPNSATEHLRRYLPGILSHIALIVA